LENPPSEDKGMATKPQDSSGADRTAVAVAGGTAAGGAVPGHKDERLVQVSRLTRLMQRPGLGALMGVVAIFLVFGGFDARVLILDEPTSALGVRQSGIVLKYIVQAREMGKGVIFITHNPRHAYPVGDRFYLLKRGRLMASVLKSETTIDGLTDMMAGGAELEELSRELMDLTAGAGAPDPGLTEVARTLAGEAPAPASPDGDVPETF
jgi:hypothetical protein